MSRKKSNKKRDVLFYTGVGLITTGLGVASPLDELLTAAATGGAGVLAAPVQGPVTLLGGAAMTVVGGTLILISRRF